MNKLLLVLLAAYVAAGSANPVQYVQSVDCSDLDQISCSLVKLYCSMTKAGQLKDIKILDGITLVREKPVERTGKSLQQSELEIINELPKDTSDRMIKLATMFYNAGNSFADSHSLSLNLSKQSISRALNEGRAKLKKLWPIIGAVAIKILAFPLLFGFFVLITKALMVGKLALTLAFVTAFDKFFPGKIFGDSYPSNPIQNVAPTGYPQDVAATWFANSGHQHPGYRNVNNAKIDAHNLAYSAHAPVPNVTK